MAVMFTPLVFMIITRSQKLVVGGAVFLSNDTFSFRAHTPTFVMLTVHSVALYSRVEMPQKPLAASYGCTTSRRYSLDVSIFATPYDVV